MINLNHSQQIDLPRRQERVTSSDTGYSSEKNRKTKASENDSEFKSALKEEIGDKENNQEKELTVSEAESDSSKVSPSKSGKNPINELQNNPKNLAINNDQELDHLLNLEVELIEEAPLTQEAELELNLKKEELLLKKQNGTDRFPAIDLSDEEIDSKLLSNEDFLAQKKIVDKKIINNPYGMKNNVVDFQKNPALNELKELKLNPDFSIVNNSANAPVNSQQFILSLNQEMKVSNPTETQVSKVFDMSQIKTSNTNEIMGQITDYIVQAKAAKDPSVNLRFNHDDLGLIDITVSKVTSGQDFVAIQIGTQTLDAKNFFQMNTKELLGHMTSAGINVSDLKLETSNQSRNDFNSDSRSQSDRHQEGSEKKFGSEQNQRRHESDRRQNLWKILNGEAA